MGKLFGTDGVRGRVNQHPMTPETALRMGRAMAHMIRTGQTHIRHDKNQGIVIGKDTRMSGLMFESAMISGICSAGVDVKLTGIMPTPGVAFLVRDQHAGAGIVISASHNPYYDNGIKVFNPEGYKLSDQMESEIEETVLNPNLGDQYKNQIETGQVIEIKDAEDRYTRFLHDSVPQPDIFKELKIVLDCSNGAGFRVAPKLFSDLGAVFDCLFDKPDGKNINQDCGSEHPDVLRQTVLKKQADLGLALDGDGDRLIAVDEKGEVLSGDQILAVCARHMKHENRLKENLVVSTVMSNIGLGLALKDMGVQHLTTRVGDRYVMEEMVQRGAVLGGENSGHTIFLDHQTTGDGLLTALKLIQAMMAADRPMSEVKKIMTLYPQALINVDVTDKPGLDTIPGLEPLIRQIEKDLKGEGRVLVRYSGTQPQCRVMVEGPGDDVTQRYCQEIAEIINKNIGKLI